MMPLKVVLSWMQNTLQYYLRGTFQNQTEPMTERDPPFSVAIIGAGIGGLALAIGLVKQNVKCTVYEAAAKFDAVGAGIGLGPNALRAMELMDAKFAQRYDEVKVGNKSPERQHEQFEILGTEPGFGISEDWRGGSVGHPEFERSSAHRKALLEIMKSLIPAGTVVFNKRIVNLEQTPGSKVAIAFQDGTNVEADIVVGCDGIKGISRRAVLESRYPEEVRAKYNHTYVYRGIAPMEEATKRIGSYAEDARWWMGKGRGWAMYPISKGTEANIVAFVYDENEWEGEQAAKAVTREEMLAEFTEFDPRLQALLDVSINFPPVQAVQKLIHRTVRQACQVAAFPSP
jgi:salicylate hydroxylase